MNHRQKIILLLFASAIMIAIVIVAFSSIVPILHAQNSIAPQNIKFFPLNSYGTGTNNNSASWQKSGSGYIQIGQLPTSSSNSTIDIYLANPTTFATSTLLLHTVPTSTATSTYAINLNNIKSLGNGSYGLVLVYSANGSSQKYTINSPISLSVNNNNSNTSQSNSYQNNSSSDNCSYGFVYNSTLHYCGLPDGSIGASFVPITCPPGYSFNGYTYEGSMLCVPNPIKPVVHSNPSPTVPLTPTNTNPPITSPAPIVQSSNDNSGLVKCTGARDPSNPNDKRPICDFNYLLIEGRTVINWLFVISIPIATVLFAFGGILYILGTPGNRTRANGIFTAAGIGFGIMLIAWVSVYTIVSWLTTGTNGGSTNSTGITTFLGQ